MTIGILTFGEAVLACTHNLFFFEEKYQKYHFFQMTFSIFALENIFLYIAWASFRNDGIIKTQIEDLIRVVISY